MTDQNFFCHPECQTYHIEVSDSKSQDIRAKKSPVSCNPGDEKTKQLSAIMKDTCEHVRREETNCVLHLRVYSAALPTNPPDTEFDPGVVGKSVLVCDMTSLRKWSIMVSKWPIFHRHCKNIAIDIFRAATNVRTFEYYSFEIFTNELFLRTNVR